MIIYTKIDKYIGYSFNGLLRSFNVICSFKKLNAKNNNKMVMAINITSPINIRNFPLL
jgi:hypothetical protein